MLAGKVLPKRELGQYAALLPWVREEQAEFLREQKERLTLSDGVRYQYLDPGAKPWMEVSFEPQSPDPDL